LPIGQSGQERPNQAQPAALRSGSTRSLDSTGDNRHKAAMALDRVARFAELARAAHVAALVCACQLCACHIAEPIDLPPAPRADTASSAGDQREALPGPVQSLALGSGYTCALLTGGAVKCWGSDAYGVLGQDTQAHDVSDPSAIAPIDFGDARRVVQLSAGWYHVCVLFEDARARCWGRNESGQLGQGNTEDYGDDAGETLNALPDIPLERVVQISAGVSNTCALVRAGEGPGGTVHCFGSDRDGAIGDTLSGDFGDDEAVTTLRPAALVEIATSVAAGDGVNCALLSNDTVQCWGGNAFGTLGVGGEPCALGEPCGRSFAGVIDEPVANLQRRFVSAVQLNQAHACTSDNYGELLCWGRNDQSRAGYPQAIYGSVISAPPGPVSLGPGVQVLGFGLGMRHGCALDAHGLVRCWGEAGPALGYGMTQADGLSGVGGTLEPSAQYALMPEQGAVRLGDTDGEPGIDRALRVFSGGQHNCVILSTGGVRCWGSNRSGELGYGAFDQVGNIGDDGPPEAVYARREQYDVCIGEGSALTTSCAR
jgi:alpha-tubulin suppressor-like RCC1 family protein